MVVGEEFRDCPPLARSATKRGHKPFPPLPPLSNLPLLSPHSIPRETPLPSMHFPPSPTADSTPPLLLLSSVSQGLFPECGMFA